MNIGIDSSIHTLSAVNGYYNNPLTLIPLPPEVKTITDNLQAMKAIPLLSALVPNIETKLEDLTKSINASAGKAAKDATPIFKNAITNLSITDGLNLLRGNSLTKSSNFDSLAITEYLETQTKGSLTEVFSPYMNDALGQPFMGTASATSLWNDITGGYNTVVGKANLLSGVTGKSFNVVNTDLGNFVTEKALDGLFFKVGEQEKQIRRNPLQYASDIIKKVFGYVFK